MQFSFRFLVARASRGLSFVWCFPMASKLTDKQARFVEEYLVDHNATQAAIRAGYTKKNADTMACQLLRKTQVMDAIKEAKEKRNARVRIDQDWLMNELYLQYHSAVDSDQKQIAMRALELIGKHVQVDAFNTKKLEVSATISHEDALELLK